MNDLDYTPSSATSLLSMNSKELTTGQLRAAARAALRHDKCQDGTEKDTRSEGGLHPMFFQLLNKTSDREDDRKGFIGTTMDDIIDGVCSLYDSDL